MGSIFSKLGDMIEQRPFKVLFAVLMIFVFLIAGVKSIELATGDNTLVKGDNPVYLNNREMQSKFGGESILVLFHSKNREELLTAESMQKIWKIEKNIKENEGVFSVMSPAGLINQIADKQSEEIKENILDISQGLSDISTKLSEVGYELKQKELMNPAEMQNKLASLSDAVAAFDQLIAGQHGLAEGAAALQGGLVNAADGLTIVSGQLLEISQKAAGNPEVQMKLEKLSYQIAQNADGLKTMGDKSGNIVKGTEQTAGALGKIKDNLTKETTLMKGQLDHGFNPDEIREMASGFTTMGEKLNSVAEGLALFYEKSEMMVADIPSSQTEMNTMLYGENGVRSIFSDVIIDEEHMLMAVKLQGNLKDSDKDAIVDQLSDQLIRADFENLDYVLSGKPVLDASLRAEMQANMKQMVMLAAVIMIIVLTLIFKVRWRILSLGIILISVIATLGLMGWIGVPITMVSMAVFPILIGLGIDYSIQFHNRYEEEKSVQNTVAHIGKAVAVAVLATFLGFISLYASPVPMIQDFGKMLTIGVVISFIGSLLILMPILKARDVYTDTSIVENKSSKPGGDTILDRILVCTTGAVTKFSIFIIITAVIVSAFGFYYDGQIGVQSNIESFMPQDMDALLDIREIRDTVGSTEQVVLLLEDPSVLADENIKWIREKSEAIADKYSDIVVGVKSIDTLAANMSLMDDTPQSSYIERINSLPQSQRKLFINEDGTQSVIMVEIKYLPTEELQEFIDNLEQEIADAPMDAKVTGKSVLDVEMVKGLTSGRVEMTIIGLGLVFAALLAVYRNFFKALIPLIPVVLIIGMSAGAMYLLGIRYTPITATLGALILGMGTEMTVMVMERYLEERTKGIKKQEAIIVSVKMIGKAILASGLTTIGGFSVLMFSDFVILQDFGLMTVINIALALLSTFFVLPAVALTFDRFLFSKQERKA